MNLAARVPGVRSLTGSDPEAISGLARWGLATRATNYVLVGALAMSLAFHRQSGETDQHGALEQVTKHSGGTALVWVIAGGLFAYALWRLYEAVFGVSGKKDGAGPRLLSLFRAAVYVVLGASAVQIALHSGGGNKSQKQQQWTAQVMAHTGGRWLVGALGVGLVIFGAAQVVKGFRRSFEKKFELERMGSGSRRTVETLGAAGVPGRGVVFALVGIFVTVAAIEYDPAKAGGLDRALREVRDMTAGPYLIALVSVGLIVFGLYGYCEAIWRRT